MFGIGYLSFLATLFKILKSITYLLVQSFLSIQINGATQGELASSITSLSIMTFRCLFSSLWLSY
jgi:hypothetical protein